MASMDDIIIPRKRTARQTREDPSINDLEGEAVRRSKRPRKSAGGITTPAHTPRGERAMDRSEKKLFDGVVLPASKRSRSSRKSRSSDAGNDNPGDDIKSQSEIVDQNEGK